MGLRDERISPQFILYTPDEATWLANLCTRGIIPFERPNVLDVLGRYKASQQSTPAEILPFIQANWPCFGLLSSCAFGQGEAACVVAGALLCGDVRTGFENNHLLPNGEIAGGNEDLVDVIRMGLELLGMPG